MHDLMILGGGPAGLTAMTFAMRRRLDALLVSDQLGGKTNYHLEVPFKEPGRPMVGAEIVNQFRAQIEALGFPYVQQQAERVDRIDEAFTVQLADGTHHECRALIIATGAQPNPMGIEGEARFLGHGLSYSSVSHAPMFHHRTVVVCGDGKLAPQAAAELAVYADSVHLLLPEGHDPHEPFLQLLGNLGQVTIHTPAEPIAIHGDEFARSITIRTPADTIELAVDGVFIERPLKPNTQMVSHMIALNEEGRVLVNEHNETSLPGCFAAGDVSATYGEQVVIAIGEGAKAALSAIQYLVSAGRLYGGSGPAKGTHE